MAKLPRQSFATVLLVAAAASFLVPASALSWPTCSDGGSVWVTEAPHLEPSLPASDLMFFCQGGLNIAGASISPCVNRGAACTPAIPNAICALLGYDEAWDNDYTLAPALPGEPVQALTGELCLRAGVWVDNDSQVPMPADLEAMPGSPCMKVDSITCIRHRTTMVNSLAAQHLSTLQAVPAAEDSGPGCASMDSSCSATPQVQAADGGSGRKLLR